MMAEQEERRARRWAVGVVVRRWPCVRGSAAWVGGVAMKRREEICVTETKSKVRRTQHSIVNYYIKLG